MAQHDDYGKRLLTLAVGPAFQRYGPALTVDYGAGQGGRIDGVIAGEIAVEIESRVSKQIRGAVLDLICHPFPKKLLVILPVHADNPELTATQCRNIMSRFLDETKFRVIVVTGSGSNPRLEKDAKILMAAARELGYKQD